MQAKFGLTLGEIQAGNVDEKKYCAIRYLSVLGLDLLGKAKLQLKGLDARSPGNAGAHHVMISAAVIEKRLNRLRVRPAGHAQRGAGHVSEVVAAWWRAIHG